MGVENSSGRTVIFSIKRFLWISGKTLKYGPKFLRNCVHPSVRPFSFNHQQGVKVQTYDNTSIVCIYTYRYIQTYRLKLKSFGLETLEERLRGDEINGFNRADKNAWFRFQTDEERPTRANTLSEVMGEERMLWSRNRQIWRYSTFISKWENIEDHF